MTPKGQHRHRLGTARPSHLMFTSGVGSLVDLPNFSVLVRGIDGWRHDTLPDCEPLPEPRLLRAVGDLLKAPSRNCARRPYGGH